MVLGFAFATNAFSEIETQKAQIEDSSCMRIGLIAFENFEELISDG